MRLIDTHSHVYVEEFDADREAVIDRAREAGVVGQLLPAIDDESYERLFATCRAYPGYCLPMMGLHPTSVNDNPRWREALERVERLLADPPGMRFRAVGEIGLDFYWSDGFRTEQTEALRRQIELALRYDLPIAVHTRSAWSEMTALIETFAGSGLRGVFHAFSDTAETVREMELDDLVLETDCPYLTPTPYRGRRNEPAYVALVCEAVARLTGLAPAAIAERTTRRAERLFGLQLTEETT